MYKFIPFFRKKRMARFVDVFKPNKNTQIIDVGGSAFNWDLIQAKSNITLLNLSKPKVMLPTHGNYEFVVGDGTALAFADNQFDISYSNSEIEHLHSWEKQKLFASEIRRVGRKVWVQTPAKNFFIEPHFITPFIHYFSKNLQRHMLRNFSVWGWITRPSQKQIDSILHEIRLLTLNEMKELFPDCVIEKEKFLFFTKCFIAIRQ